MAAKRWTEEEALEHDGQCPKHGAVLGVRVVEDKELGGKRILYTCQQCVDEETGEDAPKCKTCGAKVKWATTPSGKKMPLDLGTTTARLENGEWVTVHISHFITCPQAAEHRKDHGPPAPAPEEGGEPPVRRAPNQRPRTGAPWDKCKRCGTATNWTESDQKPRRDGKPGFVIFDNWSCPEQHGHWWKIQGSDYKPEWKDKK